MDWESIIFQWVWWSLNIFLVLEDSKIYQKLPYACTRVEIDFDDENVTTMMVPKLKDPNFYLDDKEKQDQEQSKYDSKEIRENIPKSAMVKVEWTIFGLKIVKFIDHIMVGIIFG